MAKGKQGGGKGKGPRGRKPTRPDKVLGPRRLTDAERAEAAKRQEAELAEEFERRKRAQLAKAALELDPTDLAILGHALNHPGLTQEQLGDLVGLRRQAVNERMNAPKFKRALEAAGRTALEIFEANKAKAARKLGALIDSPDDRVAIRAAIAHMWPEIHREDKGSGGDFVAFIQEAFERATGAQASSAEGGPAAAAEEA